MTELHLPDSIQTASDKFAGQPDCRKDIEVVEEFDAAVVADTLGRSAALLPS